MHFLSLGLHEGRLSYRRLPSALKREHPALKSMKFILGHFCSPGSGSRSSRPKSMQIHADLDPDQQTGKKFKFI
jgi:hypothetical protein